MMGLADLPMDVIGVIAEELDKASVLALMGTARSIRCGAERGLGRHLRVRQVLSRHPSGPYWGRTITHMDHCTYPYMPPERLVRH